MIRPVISLDVRNKEGLDQQAKKENISTPELIRTAVRKTQERDSGRASCWSS